jgi:hypothetical protein
MPAAARESASMVQGPPSPQTIDPGPLPSFGKQLAQLVIIPAAIALVAIALFWLFGSIAATPDSLKDQLTRLKQSSGYGGNLIAGSQDPRYKDRCQAAFQVAAIIEKMMDESRRLKMTPGELAKLDEESLALSKELVSILEDRVHADDADLTYFMVMAIGRLAQEGGFEPIMKRADSPHLRVRIGVLGALLGWADKDPATAHTALPTVLRMLADPHEPARTFAAAAVWKIATPADTQAIAPLKEAMASIGVDPNQRIYQATVTHSAIALAALGDEQGVLHVVNTLLNRRALATMRADETGQSDALMNVNEQDHMIAATLHFVGKMTDERIWAKVKELAANDPSVSIRNAALQLLSKRPGAEAAK